MAISKRNTQQANDHDNLNEFRQSFSQSVKTRLEVDFYEHSLVVYKIILLVILHWLVIWVRVYRQGNVLIWHSIFRGVLPLHCMVERL